jgi:hypothetical protein
MLTLAACGSSIRVEGQPYGGDQSPSEIGGGDAGSRGTPGSGDGVGATPGSAPVAGSGGTSGGMAGAGGSSGGVVGGGRAGSTGGVAASGGQATLAPVQVGLLVYPDVSAFAASFGGSTGNTSNQESSARATIAWINSHGGLAGHKVELVVHTVNLTSSDTYAQQEDQACSDFGQDHHVLVAMTAASSIDNQFPNCLAQYHILDITGGNYLHDETDFRQVTNLVAPSEPNTSNVGRALVDELTGRTFLKSGDTLGMLTEDAPAGIRTTRDVITPLLKARGVSVVNYTIHGPSSTPDISNSAAAIQNAELRMAAAGVKNVAFMCKGCFGLFISYAESQQYYPRYFLHSIDNIRTNVSGQGHTRSMQGAVALSSAPLSDIGGYSHPKEFTGNAARTSCKQLAGKTITDDSSEYIAQSICGGFLDLYAAAGVLNGAPLTDKNLMAGFNTFGTSHVSAVNFATKINAGRHYGAVGYRRMHYASSCDCFEYDDHVLHPFAQ